jgi:hypothetical protein
VRSLPETLLRVAPTLAMLALVIAFGLFIAQRFGVFPETVTVQLHAGAATGGAPEARDLRMVTLLPKDGIPAIFDPDFVTALEADERFFEPGDLVIGVEINGDARAYGIAHLSRHEIVNDTVGGVPIAVTW